MERLNNISQLKKGVRFYIVYKDKISGYEFLCVHPHNENYILALDIITQDAPKLYIPTLLGGEVYVGEYDSKFFLKIEIEYHKKEISSLKERINLTPEKK